MAVPCGLCFGLASGQSSPRFKFLSQQAVGECLADLAMSASDLPDHRQTQSDLQRRGCYRGLMLMAATVTFGSLGITVAELEEVRHPKA